MQTIHASLVADIVRKIDPREASPVNLPSLLENYYADTDAHDLSSRDAQDWYGAALAHLKLAQTRKAGESLVRVYNPSFDDHRWQSSHTVIELVNDDKPFLVDTVSLTLSRMGYGLHIIVHPIFQVERDAKGKLELMGSGKAESWMHLEIDRVTDKARLD
ncbi:MAG: NAD-glutamate dehydrogenase, partial [Burkholderiales bacterium]|nr:NAD-glutamate dehydrogenase [Burkholderiales bacterium]